MALFLEELVKEIAGSLSSGNPVTGFMDDDIPAVELDPVARITQETADSASGIPNALAATDPLDELVDLDQMTNSFKEFQQARRTVEQTTPGSSANFQAAQAATMPRTTTTDRFVKRMLAKKGLSYQWGFEGATDPVTGEPAWDCSGIIVDTMQSLGFDFPRTNSAGIYARSNKISLKKAINTRGAILYREGHIAISLGNGKTIEAMGEDYGVVIGNAKGRFTAGGILPELKTAAGGGKRNKKKGNAQLQLVTKKAKPANPTLTSITSPTAVFGGVMDEMEAPILKMREARGANVGAKAGMRGVKGQLYEGFMEAGRPDLAKMVFTKTFDTWIGKESGWRPGVVSPANNQGMPTGGLFQFWQGHDWAKKYFKNGEFTASPYEQAILAATHFDLTTRDIKQYAQQIRNNTYVGWG